MTAHEHTWTQHAPATEGATPVSTCPCGLYRVELTHPTLGERFFYEDADGMAAMLRAFRATRAASAATAHTPSPVDNESTRQTVENNPSSP